MNNIRQDLEAAAKEIAESEPIREQAAQVEAEQPQQQTDFNLTSEPSSIKTGSEDQQVETPKVNAPANEEIPEPTSWRGEMRQKFKDLPADVKKYIAEREAQQHAFISKRGAELGSIRKEYGEIEQVLKPYEQDLKESGLSKAQVLDRLIIERAEMQKDPITFIKKFADANKIDLLTAAMEEDQTLAPEVRRQKWEAKAERESLERQKAEIAQQQHAAGVEQIRSYVENWGSQKEHFTTVRSAMAEVLPIVQEQYNYLPFAEQLDITYNEILKHPNFSHLTKKPNLEQVKKAGSGMSGYTGTSTPQPQPNSIREALIQAAKETGYI